jgi:hypothetical protein
VSQPPAPTRTRAHRAVNTAGTYAISLLGGAIAAIISGLFLATIVFGGCRENVNSIYGQMLPRALTTSVNGTDVLGEMFVEAGHQIATRRVLVTSRLETVDAIIWFPDDRSAPSQEVCDWFDTWLAARSGRTLVYVGRDFDAAPFYWRSMLPFVSNEQRILYRQRLLHAAASVTRRGGASATVECPWFTIRAARSRPVRTLAGRWSRDIDPGNAAIELGDRLVPDQGAERLLTSPPDALVSRQSKTNGNGSQIIVVENGSFLLNLPLVNHEHRLLAERLIAAVGRPGRVIFLESDVGGPALDPSGGPAGLWRLFGAWPLNVILLQLAALGIIFCFASWPILGRPKAPPAEVISDFRKHVDAVGRLLRATRNSDYAWRQIGAPSRGSPGEAKRAHGEAT